MVVHKGLNLGVDFRGGLLIQARLEEDPGADRIRSILSEAGLVVSSLQALDTGAQSEYLINISGGEAAEGLTLTRTAVGALEAALGADKIQIRREEMVGPKVGQDLQQKALYAIYYSLLIIIIYISGRFERKWLTSGVFVGVLLGVIYVVGLFGVGVGVLIIVALLVTLATCYILRLTFALAGIIALVHDVIITAGIFSVLNKEITLSFVAAILTIIGYSLNDSIIVFDRIRENARKSRRSEYAKVINRSINETLSRTVLTSGTTLLALFSLYFLGGSVNRDFALALLIGVTVGTFSSIFIASPLLLLWDKKPDQAAA
jgi:preprotein translocase subunit SecF